MAKRISEWHPALYALRVWQKGMARHGSDWRQRATFASHLESETLPFVVKRHQSLLRRKLGDSDPRLQENKVVNLSIARQTIDGIIIEPGQTFSFWRCVGNATSQKGYVEGMRLSRGEVKVGVGGGLCQLGNLLYWMALHSPLVVSERHHHSFDPFPDEGRVLPFGSGASLFYPYLDLRFYNPTSVPIQLRVWLTDDHLKGLVAAGEELPESFHIFERNHRFCGAAAPSIARMKSGDESLTAETAKLFEKSDLSQTLPKSSTLCPPKWRLPSIWKAATWLLERLSQCS